MIISASRRTDIPAFYHRWFFNRVKEGFLLTRNPYNAKQVRRVSLLPEDVDAIVFWTRDAQKMIKYLPLLKNYNYYFQYTITGYPKLLEKHLPNTYKAIETFSQLSDLIGPEKNIWRYDPILISDVTPIDEHKRKFEKIAHLLKGKTNKVVISFADLYNKTTRNLDSISNLKYHDIVENNEELLMLCSHMVDVCHSYGLEIESCAENVELGDIGINHGKCIDDKLLYELFGLELSSLKDSGQRTECGCIKSVDIGTYNTCLHGCSYCYATFSETAVKKNKLKHDPDSPFLLGGIEGVEKHLLAKPIIQQTLF